MPLKATIIPLLLLSHLLLIMPCTAFLYERFDIGPIDINNDPTTTGFASSFTAGPYAFIGTYNWKPLLAFNETSHSPAVINNTMIPYYGFSYAITDDLVVLGNGNLVDTKFKVVDLSTAVASDVQFPRGYLGGSSVTSVGNLVLMTGLLSTDSTTTITDYFLIYNTDTKTFTESSQPKSGENYQTATSAGNFGLFANKASKEVYVYDVTTQSWAIHNLTAADTTVLQGVSIGRYAMFIAGNTADIFDSTTQSWSSHTLSQSSSSQNGFSFVKSQQQQQLFIVAAGNADVFDVTTQTWSTLAFNPSTSASYCPSTIVDNFAMFACHDSITVYDVIARQIVRTIPFDTYNNVIIQAGSVGKVAIFLCYSTFYPTGSYFLTFDFTTGPPNGKDLANVVVDPSPISVSLSTHQFSSSRAIYTIASNKAFFMSANDANVEVYDADTDSWSDMTLNAYAGALFATADDFLIFADIESSSMLHCLSVETMTWSTIEVPSPANKYWITVGNFIFYSWGSTLYVYDIVSNAWSQFDNMYEMSQSSLYAFKYNTYAVFANPSGRTNWMSAWNTANGLGRTSFSYGSDYSIGTSISVTEDYLVTFGGAIDGGYSSDFSFYQNSDGFFGKLPSQRKRLDAIQYVEPLMMFIGGSVIEEFNVETEEWQTNFIDVPLPWSRSSTGNMLFVTYENEDYFVQFNSQNGKWTNATFQGLPVGNIIELGSLATFINNDGMVMFNSETRRWTKTLFASSKQLKTAFTLGDKVLFLSSDDQSVDVTSMSQLSAAPTTAPLMPPTSPSTPTTTVPWSPWTPPIPSNSPTAAVPSGPSTGPLPTSTTPVIPTTPTSTNSPSSSSPDGGSSSSPSSPSSSTPHDLTPMTVNNNVDEVSSASLSAAAVSLIMFVGVILI
jgi:hypothetical protein